MKVYNIDKALFQLIVHGTTSKNNLTLTVPDGYEIRVYKGRLFKEEGWYGYVREEGGRVLRFQVDTCTPSSGLFEIERMDGKNGSLSVAVDMENNDTYCSAFVWISMMFRVVFTMFLGVGCVIGFVGFLICLCK